MKLPRHHIRALVKSMNTRRTLRVFILASTAFVVIAIIPGRSPATAATSAPSHSVTALDPLNTAPYATNSSAAYAIDASNQVTSKLTPRPVSSGAMAPAEIMKFTTMVGVDGAFVGHNPIRGVLGDELPWEIGSVKGSLTTDGHLQLIVRGLVFANVPSVPANLRGINDESAFRALVSCLSDDGRGKVATVNITTGGFPATTSGDSNIDTFVGLPKQCVAPIIFILSGSEDKWFAVTGAEGD